MYRKTSRSKVYYRCQFDIYGRFDIEGYSKLNFNDKPQYGDLGVYVNKEDGKILHYELFLDDTGKVDVKGGFENYVERPNGGTDRNWGDTYYVRLRLNNQKQDSDGK